MTTLVIVESSAKAKTIQGYLGDGYFVWACGGHVRHMTEKSLGFNSLTYEIEYEIDERKKDTLKKLAQDVHSGKFNHVILATDPDREGEAIAQSLYEILGLNENNYQRSKFNEITKTAISRAISDSGRAEKIDSNLVDAQEARRILDRAVGWFASSTVSKALNDRMPIGRVQSPAVRFVVDRQRAIDNFKPVKHNDIKLVVQDENGQEITFELDTKASGIELSDDKYWTDTEQVEGVIDYLNRYEAPLHCRDIVRDERFEAPPKPLTTLDMQSLAIKHLNMSGKQVDKLAQDLYQAGLITYPRTDSPRMSADGFAVLQRYGAEHNLPMVNEAYQYAAKGGAQDAHECIRPTDIFSEEAYKRAGLTEEHKTLYDLINKRAVMSQMKPRAYTNTQAIMSIVHNGQEYVFKASGNKTTDAGFKQFAGNYASDEDDDGSESGQADFSGLSAGGDYKYGQVQKVEKETKPPKQFTQSTLIKELDRQGIGRPSTFSAIFERIKEHEYIKIDGIGKYTRPTALANKMVDGTKDSFSIMDAKYTKRMEAVLDAIAEGKADKHAELDNFIASLKADLEKFRNQQFEANKTNFTCSCSSDSHLYKFEKTGKDGKSYNIFTCRSCRKYYYERNGEPYDYDEHLNKQIEAAAREENPLLCPCCNSAMVKSNRGQWTFAKCYTCGFESFVSNRDGKESVAWDSFQTEWLLPASDAKFGYVPKVKCACGAALKAYKKKDATDYTVVCSGFLADNPKRACKNKPPTYAQLQALMLEKS